MKFKDDGRRQHIIWLLVSGHIPFTKQCGATPKIRLLLRPVFARFAYLVIGIVRSLSLRL